MYHNSFESAKADALILNDDDFSIVTKGDCGMTKAKNKPKMNCKDKGCSNIHITCRLLDPTQPENKPIDIPTDKDAMEEQCQNQNKDRKHEEAIKRNKEDFASEESRDNINTAGTMTTRNCDQHTERNTLTPFYNAEELNNSIHKKLIERVTKKDFSEALKIGATIQSKQLDMANCVEARAHRVSNQAKIYPQHPSCVEPSTVQRTSGTKA